VRDLDAGVFGSIYSINGGSVYMRSLRILQAVDDSGTDVWTAAADTAPDALLILVSSDGMKAWALTGADAREIGETSNGQIVVTEGDRMIPYRANWHELLR
jgi:hypothetical protein